ncbi:MAG TPA: hypothetical protein VKJ07_15140, partial [Mycobacteriales bacterium]|nr:hypothetical protein [Mycobacteriales bacterium]
YGDDYYITDKGIFGAGLFVTFTRVQRVVVDGQAGNDRFFVQSTSPGVELVLVGSRGSDTFNVGGGNNGKPITVVSNSLSGHSGLIATLIQSADQAWKNLQAPWVSAHVYDSEAPGVKVTEIAALRVFGASSPPSGANLAVDRYTIVLTQRPTQNVIVTAAATPPNQRLQRAGAKPLLLCTTPNGGTQTCQEGGTTVLFTPGNWFLPQEIQVKTQHDDPVSQGNHFVDIVHTVQEAAGGTGGLPYDNLPVEGVSVEVVDPNTASVVLSPYDTTGAGVQNELLVSENPQGDLPKTDAYAVVLSKAPAVNTNVIVEARTDAGSQICGGTCDFNTNTGWGSTVDLTFTAGNYNQVQFVYIRAVNDHLPQGLHFSRITNTITSPSGGFLGLTADDVAAGLAAAINGDPAGRFKACAGTIGANGICTPGGSVLKITGPAFTAVTTVVASGTIAIDAVSTKAYRSDGAFTATVGGAITQGDTWTITLDGTPYSVQAQNVAGAAAKVASDLADLVNGSGVFLATAAANSNTLSVSKVGGEPFAATLGSTNSQALPLVSGTAATGVVVGTEPPADWYATLAYDVTLTATVPSGERWSVRLNRTHDTNTAVDYTWVAGRHSFTKLSPFDVKVTDANTPGVLVLQPTGSTSVIEPTTTVVLGDGSIRPVARQPQDCPLPSSP